MPAAWPFVRGLLLFAGLRRFSLAVSACRGSSLPDRRWLRPMRRYLRVR